MSEDPFLIRDVADGQARVLLVAALVRRRGVHLFRARTFQM